jgi:hypothetical protein
MTAQRFPCTLCGYLLTRPQDGERFDASEVGRHWITQHREAFEMAVDLSEILEDLGGIMSEYRAECSTCFMGFSTPHPTALEVWVTHHLAEHPDHVLKPQEPGNEG